MKWVVITKKKKSPAQIAFRNTAQNIKVERSVQFYTVIIELVNDNSLVQQLGQSHTAYSINHPGLSSPLTVVGWMTNTIEVTQINHVWPENRVFPHHNKG